MGVWSFTFDRGGELLRKKPGPSANLALQEERASKGRAAGARFLS